jgi:hypothetical protein
MENISKVTELVQNRLAARRDSAKMLSRSPKNCAARSRRSNTDDANPPRRSPTGANCSSLNWSSRFKIQGSKSQIPKLNLESYNSKKNPKSKSKWLTPN